MAAGRPSDYSLEIAEEICARIAGGQSTVEVCRSEDMPDKSTVYRWLEKHSEFRDMYARAKEFDDECEFEEMKEIADDGSNDWMERLGEDDKPKGWILNGEHVQRSKLRVDVRKWRLSKKNPKKYGDKQQIEQTNIQKYEDLSEEEIKERLEQLRNRRSESGS